MKRHNIFLAVCGSEQIEKGIELLVLIGANKTDIRINGCSGWLRINYNGDIEFFDRECSFEDGDNYVFRSYQKEVEDVKISKSECDCRTISTFPKEYIEYYKDIPLQCRKFEFMRLLTQPVVTKKEYEIAIEVLKEVLNHYNTLENTHENYWNKVHYECVINDLKKLLNNK